MHRHTRLFTAGILLAISAVMLVGASVAWFTISTGPEIGGMQVQLCTDQALLVSDAQDGNYAQMVNLGDTLSRYVALRPVSTVDGVNWFLPAYEPSGPLKDPSEFVLDDDLSHANVLKYSPDGAPLEGTALEKARERGYYVYADFWLKTEEDTCDVRLSVPAETNLNNWETEQGAYGTYALAGYELEDENLAVLDTRAQAALRVGFLVGEGGSRRFVIYEPNADERSSAEKPESSESDTAGRYVAGFDKSDGNYSEGYYIPTRPIGKNQSGVGALADIDGANLIIQQKSAWNLDALRQTLLDGKTPGSNEVGVMGRFVPDNAALMSGVDAETGMAATGGTAPAAETVILTLTRNNPQRIRMFIWIEGQDVDCWNDIAAGSFVINLELAGDTD